MSVKVNAVVIVVLVVLVVLALPISVGAKEGEWTKQPGNPLLKPSPGSWDANYVILPRVLYDKTTGSFQMWYVGGGQNTIGIGYATSTDGITWNKHAGPVLSPGPAGSWDGANVGLGSVIWDGSKYWMWYRGAGLTTFLNGAVGVATSPDGITWTKYSNNPILRPSSVDDRLLTSPFVLFSADTFNMWYTARSSSDPASSQVSRILYASSFDGYVWSKFYKPVMQPSTNTNDWDSGGLYAPTLFYDGTTYGMWYTGVNQTYLTPKIGFAKSQDGVVWNKTQANPVLGPGAPVDWDSRGVENAGITASNGIYMLYFDGIGGLAGNNIGLAESPSGFAIPEFSSAATALLLSVLASFTAYSIFRRRNIEFQV
jgi:predicted GH43/DUF377 family glycosyl hydrolase